MGSGSAGVGRSADCEEQEGLVGSDSSCIAGIRALLTPLWSWSKLPSIYAVKIAPVNTSSATSIDVIKGVNSVVPTLRALDCLI